MTADAERHFGKADFEELCQHCNITQIVDAVGSPVGTPLDVFICLSVSDADTLFLYIGSITTTDPQWTVFRKLDDKFPTFVWRIDFSVFS